MAPLTAAQRKALPSSKFGLPATRQYPLDTVGRAKIAKPLAKADLNKKKITTAQYNTIISAANAALKGFGVKTAAKTAKKAPAKKVAKKTVTKKTTAKKGKK